MLILPVLGLIFFSLILLKATDILIVHIRSLERKTALGGFVLTSFFIGLSTSFPELFVGLTSVFEGVPLLSLGNVLGANITNLSLVVGLSSFLGGGLKLSDKIEKGDLLRAFALSLIPFLLLFDGTLSRTDGLILLSLYGFFYFLILKERQKNLVSSEGFWRGILRHFNHRKTSKELVFIFGSLVLIVFSADILVRLGKNLTAFLDFSPFLVGLFFLSFGTTLPELFFNFKALRKKESEMVVGNLIGSIVANSGFVLGLVVLLSPIKIASFSDYFQSAVFFIFFFSLLYFFLKTKNELEAWEGASLVIGYVLFFIFKITTDPAR